MEEVEDIIPETVPEEFPEEVEVIPESIPEPPPLKRATNKLKDKVTCEGCGKSLSLHAYKYSHKCKARAPDEPAPSAARGDPVAKAEPKAEPKKKVANVAKLAESLKPAMTQAQSQKPIR